MRAAMHGIGICSLAIGWAVLSAPGAWAAQADGSASGGFWPSDRMLQYFVKRASRDLAEEYELSDQQLGQTEAQMLSRWPKWIKKNQQTIQPLFNEMIEMRINPDPPDPAAVADWAKRALPMFDEFRTEIEKGNEDFRAVLKPRQQARFDAQRLVFAMGLDVTEKRLKRWRQGKVEPTEVWDAPGRDQRRKRRSTELAKDDKGARPIDRWQAYVDQFILRYQLDENQAESARSILVEIRTRAQKHLDTVAEQLTTINRQMNGATKDTRVALNQQRKKLQKPVEELFDELQRRLEALLTSAQRRMGGAEPG